MVPRQSLLLALFLAGCAQSLLEVELEGTVPCDVPAEQPLGFDAAGRPRIFGRRVHLPRAQEDRRFGLVLVDARPLPPGWRPPHAPDGGVLVAAVDLAAPLALAGLRPCDLVLRVDGQPATDVAALAARLAAAPRVALAIRHLDGREETLVAEAEDGVGDVSGVGLDPLLGARWSATGGAFQLAPLLRWNSSLEWWADGYAERTGWSAILDAFHYESLRDLRTGEVRRYFELFGLLGFGDEALARW